MEIKAKALSTALLSKGFRHGGGDHVFFWFYYEGQKTHIKTKISHGEREIRDSLIRAVSHQMCISKKDLLKFVECTMSGDDYIKALQDGGQIAKRT